MLGDETIIDTADRTAISEQTTRALPVDAAPVTGLTARHGVVGAAALLAACDSGGGSGAGTVTVAGPNPTPTPTPTPTPSPTPAANVAARSASRFLAQATMGATRASIDSVLNTGVAAWIEAQFAIPRQTSHWDWMVANGATESIKVNVQSQYDASVWRQAIAGPDALRQRITLALFDYLVVGMGVLNIDWRALSVAAYTDILADHAFGNYRDLLGAITRNGAMGLFLTFVNNRKGNPSTGSLPDENYARELMQLFTLGVNQLEQDGTVRMSNGQALETYTLDDVSQLARVFTGLQLASSDRKTADRMREPLIMNSELNETGSSTFLGATVSGGGMAAIDAALDVIFRHPNIAPFVSKQLIQRLVTSNPSPAYVGRVAAAFANNGSGVRGDMKAIIRAILLDPEARDDAAALNTTTGGRLREPVLRLTNWARAFGVTSPSDTWGFGATTNTTTRLGQGIGRAPSVFGFVRPGFTPPGTAMAQAGLTAPEFLIASEQTNIAYINYMQSLVGGGTGDTKADYAPMMALASDSAKLVDEVNLILAAGQLRASTIASIRAAVDSIPLTANNATLNRTGVAILLTLASPDYLVLK
ncbi:DUF1800 domain-containing protein [Sphingomonas sp. Leaf10]|uniref:DUF1800 domain-containing protein n=1 Tax=Sphingomonas sp. Leaf10 TaxID=1735676 RepID=UPI0006FDA449|nr:DUF1800 domain-containing protein [Sphingomonas sp. Leaf10]KQM35956.1 hypothetical protein ASE59_17030 [Sphingomonas sp. Leaf10]